MSIDRFDGTAPWEWRYGYCRVVVAGGWAITAGTTAAGPDGTLHVGDPYAQTRAALHIALTALQQAGGHDGPSGRPGGSGPPGRGRVEAYVGGYGGIDGETEMRLVVQRVTSARVEVDGKVVGAIHQPGLLILVGVTHDDTVATADRLAEKVWTLRILADERSAEQDRAPVLVVSQFTLYADTRKGRRPSWSAAAPRSVSQPLVDAFVDALRRLGAEVATGIFGAEMAVSSVNDGPVTLVIDS